MAKNKIIGTLRTHPKGFGFVKIKDKKQEVFIPPTEINNAMDQDIVEIELEKIEPEKGPAGKIIKIVERTKKFLAGIIIKKENKMYFAYVPSFGKDKKVYVKSKQALKKGDRILMQILSYNDEIICQITKFIGSINNPYCDTQYAIESYQINEEFSKESLNEAKKLKKLQNKKNRKDLTNLECITIDPTTAKDFDDALSISVSDNKFHLGVHIADVAHYIKANSKLDKEAYKRGNSTYFPDRTVPMLPFELSNELCSLKPGVIKLCISVFMTFDNEGNLLDYKILRSTIKSRMRFTYEEAYKVLKDTTKSPFSKTLKHMEKLALLLKKKRFLRGSIDFSIDEAKVMVDKNGIPKEIKIIPYDISHQLVEEFMLKANETVAIHLQENRKKMLIYRTHEHPMEKNFEDFFMAARALGFHVPDNPTHLDIQDIFSKAKDTDLNYYLSIMFIKNMKLALYTPDNIGHYGLALDHYCHFTSPIRRYNDLIIQRLLFDEEDGKQKLNQIADNLSELERNSFQAENFVILLKKLRLLKKNFKKDRRQKFTATITNIKQYGIVFEIKDYYIEGFLHLSSLFDDYYIFEPHRARLVGQKTKNVYSFGDKIELLLSKIDLIFLKTEWRLIGKINK